MSWPYFLPVFHLGRSQIALFSSGATLERSRIQPSHFSRLNLSPLPRTVCPTESILVEFSNCSAAARGDCPPKGPSINDVN